MDEIFDERDMWTMHSDEKNSMSYWFGKLEKIDGIRMPPTRRIPLNKKIVYSILFSESNPEKPEDVEYAKQLKNKLLSAAIELSPNYPVFIRTSEVSGKHQWDETCFVDSEEKLMSNFWRLVETNYLALDEVPDAVFVRDYIPMESYFTGWYHNFPVNKEVRTFFRKGEIMCIHPYWPKQAMVEAKPSDPDWESKYNDLCQMNEDDSDEIFKMLALVMPHFQEEFGWSCDFSKGKDGLWYLIDMAMYPVSYHFPGCDHSPKIRLKDGTIKKDPRNE